MRGFISVVALAVILFTSLLAQTPQPSPTQPTPQQQQKAQPKCTDNGTYVNSKGETVKRPENCSASPLELPPNAETEVTVSARAAEGHALIMVELLNGFEG